jgi:hypothetical protein
VREEQRSARRANERAKLREEVVAVRKRRRVSEEVGRHRDRVPASREWRNHAAPIGADRVAFANAVS